MAKNGEVALRLQPGGGLCVPCYPAVDKSGRRRDRDPSVNLENHLSTHTLTQYNLSQKSLKKDGEKVDVHAVARGFGRWHWKLRLEFTHSI
jgi:hypothetical protein